MNSHNSFETDGSLSRYDYYLNVGDDYSWQVEPYLVLSDVAKAKGDDFGLDTMHDVHWLRWTQSSEGFLPHIGTMVKTVLDVWKTDSL